MVAPTDEEEAHLVTKITTTTEMEDTMEITIETIATTGMTVNTMEDTVSVLFHKEEIRPTLNLLSSTYLDKINSGAL